MSNRLRWLSSLAVISIGMWLPCQVYAEVVVSPAAPVLLTPTPIRSCANRGNIEFKVVYPGTLPTTGTTEFRLYSAESGGIRYDSRSASTTAVTFSYPVYSSTTLWMATYNTNGGESLTRTPIPITIIEPPTGKPGVVTPVSGITGGQVTLKATGAGAGILYRWSGTGIGTRTTVGELTVAVPEQSNANFVEVSFSTTESCEAGGSNNKAIISITVYPRPVVTGSVIAWGEPSPLLASPGYDTYTWYIAGNPNPVKVSAHAKDNIYVTNVAGSYTVVVTKNGSSGQSLPFALTTEQTAQRENYMLTNTVQQRGVTSEAAVAGLTKWGNTRLYQYFDGLGRLKQMVSTLSSPAGYDLVQPVYYDRFGRESIRFLPVAGPGRNGWYKPGIVSPEGYTGMEATNNYNNGLADQVTDDSAPLARTRFEQSPLNRVIQQGMPGSDWQPNEASTYASPVPTDHSLKMSYEYNVENEVLLWKYNKPSTYDPLGSVVSRRTTSDTAPVYYAAGQLQRNRTKDEHHHEVIEYIDREGRTVLKRVQAVAATEAHSLTDENKDTNYASTYYIYDELGGLVCVIPPEATRRLDTEYHHLTDGAQAKADFLNRWAFRYTYDKRRRMTQKQVPGAAAIYRVYDDRDRLVMTQDGNQRGKRQWLFTKYDVYNRPVLTGMIKWGSGRVISQAEGQEDVNDFYDTHSEAWFEQYVGATAGHVHGYSDVSYPQTDTLENYLTVTYYDDYRFKTLFGSPAFDYKANELEADAANGYDGQDDVNLAVRGQVTGLQVRLLTDQNWLRTVNYYDDKYRLIQQIDENVKGYTVSTNVYDFVGKVRRTRSSLYTTQPVAVAHPTYFVKNLLYDHAGRLIDTRFALDGGQEILLSRHTYNELGQLVDKSLHKEAEGVIVSPDPEVGSAGVLYGSSLTLDTYRGEKAAVAINRVTMKPGFRVLAGNRFSARIGYSPADAAENNRAVSFVQSVDYRYNVRGWLTSVNNAELSKDDVTNDDLGDLFGMNLEYTSNPSGLGASPQYNGNISSIRWSKDQGLGDIRQNAYRYRYDPMNRLTDAGFNTKGATTWQAEPNNGFSESNLRYDLNGNIKSLNRNDGRAGGIMDQLVYDYGGNAGGNKLGYVRDHGDPLKGFIEGNTGVDDYTYDDNGNLVTDRNKGITQEIVYNHLNLPQQITKADNQIHYVYDAAGTKHAQVVTSPGGQSLTTQYVGPWVFENNQLQFLQHDEGRIVLASRKLVYKNAGDDLESLVAGGGASLAAETINGETYIKITETASAPVKTSGLLTTGHGQTFAVDAGERYLFRVKGYYTTMPHALYVKANTGDLIWPGMLVQQGATNEAWVETVVVVPPAVTQLTFGVSVYSTNSASDDTYINDIEIYQLQNSDPEYQYHLKDHLGNVRVTLTTKNTTEQYHAGFETPSQEAEAAEWEHYPSGGAINTTAANAQTGTNSELLNGGYNGQIGVAKSFAVMPGDQVQIQAYASYGAPSQTSTDFSGFVPALLAAFNLPVPAPGELATASSALSAFGNWEVGEEGNASEDDPMKAFVTIVIFDKDHNFLDVAYATSLASGTLISKSYTVKQPGYAYLYISNEQPTQLDMYFDDITITHTPSPVIQTDDYYPFGLTFNSYAKENRVTQDYEYNGKEKQDELGLGWFDYGQRMYDAALGRWWVIDPVSNKMPTWSPYSYAFNNPIRFIDVEGLIPYPITIRSFAPFKTFGGGFHGDNRGYSTDQNASARVHQKINFDTDKTAISAKTWSSPTWHSSASGFVRTAIPEGGIEKGSFKIKSSGEERNFEFKSNYAGANPLTPGAPDINVFSSLSITENKKEGILNVAGKLTGDNFPSTEAFISDPSGQSVFLGVGFYEGSPFSSLWGENKDRDVSSFNLSITTDSDGNFTGVKVNDKSFSLAEWNKLFQQADPHKNENEEEKK